MYFDLENIVADFFEGNFGGKVKLGANMLTINEFLTYKLAACFADDARCGE